MDMLPNVLFIVLALVVEVLQLPSYTIELKDTRNFEIASDDDGNDEDESEMIKIGDILGLDRIAEDNNRYKALHSHVQHYNRRAIEQKIHLSDIVPYVQPRVADIFLREREEEPFIAGFKRELDNMNENKLTVFKTTPNVYNDEEESTITNKAIDISDGNSDGRTLEYAESSSEEYDYEKFKMEYDSHVVDIVNHKETLNFTNTEESEESPKQVIKNILDTKHLKNCTSEELEQLGVGAIKCLIYNSKDLKNAATRKKVLRKAWIALRLWLLVYFCVAIPCWCHKGWCCCCFQCKYCLPRKRIEVVKKYYVMNPPGVLVKDWMGKGQTQAPIEYIPGEFEMDAYETLESAIRNL